MDTNVHEITVFITGSIDVKSLDNKYVTKPNKKKYTIETKATDHFLISLGRRPPQPAQIEPIAIELEATTRKVIVRVKQENFHQLKMAATT